MIQLYDAKISKCIAHFVGCKANDDGVKIASNELSINSVTQETMRDYFFKSFIEKEDYYSFSHQSDVKLNTIYTYISAIFNNRNSFIAESAKIAKYLYEQSSHPKIKAGNLYIAFIDNCILDGDYVSAIGIFKSESKDKFLKLLPTIDGFIINSEIGTNIKKLDKGCLIFNKNNHSGYVVAIVDNTNKGLDARYWIEDFLHVQQIKDAYSHTKNMMSLTKSFVTKGLSQSEEISKKDKIDLLNKSLQYFKENDSFNINDFEEEVIANPDMITKFRSYKEEYESTRNINIENEFPLSESAFKKQQRSYKRTINLDNKIQITINGNSDNIEKGIDAKGTFYKIYYSNEE